MKRKIWKALDLLKYILNRKKWDGRVHRAMGWIKKECPNCGSTELQNKSAMEGFILCVLCGTRYDETGNKAYWSDPL